MHFNHFLIGAENTAHLQLEKCRRGEGGRWNTTVIIIVCAVKSYCACVVVVFCY